MTKQFIGYQLAFLIVGGLCRAAAPDPGGYFAIEVADAQTGRGVPVVELQTTSGVRLQPIAASVPRPGRRTGDLPGRLVRQHVLGQFALDAILRVYNQIMYRLDLADPRLKLPGESRS